MLRASIASSGKQLEKEKLYEGWKSEDNASIIPEFTAPRKINAELSDDLDTIEYIDLFLDDEFFDLVTMQANLYAAQYMQANLQLPPHSH